MPIDKSKIYPIITGFNRMIFVLGVSILTYLFSARLPTETRILVIYDLAIFTYIVLFFIMMVISTAEDTYHISQNQEASNIVTLSVAIICSIIILIGIGFLLDTSDKWTPLMKNIHLAFSLLAIFFSWLVVHIFFAIHYARVYYKPIIKQGETTYSKGLDFPNQELIDYWDFLYYSLTIGMCYQTSDISISSYTMRRITMIHAIISFFLVSGVIGLVVNLVSNIV